MLQTSILISACVVQLSLGQEYYDYVSECPEENGFFADALQCDRYYECQLGEVTEHLCEDGLVFDESSHAFAKCSFPFSINCTGRPELQPAQSVTEFCPRKNGYFADPDLEVCDVFYFCVDGAPNKVTCPGGLVFDPSLGQCGWTDQVKRKGCRSKDLFEFQCPNQDVGNADHTRHLDPKSCTEFFLCIGGQPRKSGCSQGLVYNHNTTSCERQNTLPESDPCYNYFNQTYLEEVLPKPQPTRDILNRNRPQQDNFQRRRPERPQSQTNSRQPPQAAQPVENREPDFSNLPPQLQELAQNSDLGFKGGESASFFNSLRGRIANKPLTTTTISPFTRPAAAPRRTLGGGRRPPSVSSETSELETAPRRTLGGGRRPPSVISETSELETTGSRFSSNTGSGSRFSGGSGSRFNGNTGSGSRFASSSGSRFNVGSQPQELVEEQNEDRFSTDFETRRAPQSRVPPRVVAQREESLSNVRGSSFGGNTDSRLDIQNLDNLGPSDLDAFLTRTSAAEQNSIPVEPVPSAPVPTETPTGFGQRRRVPISRTRTARPRPQPATEPTQVEEEDQRVTNSFSRGGLPPRRSQIRGGPQSRRPSSESSGSSEAAADFSSQRRPSVGARRPAVSSDDSNSPGVGSGRISGSGLRRRVRPRPEQSTAEEQQQQDTTARRRPRPEQSITEEQQQETTSRRRPGGRLEVSQPNLPPLQTFDEEDFDIGSFPSFQQSRGPQG